MSILNTFVNGFNSAVEAVSTTAQTFVKKNRTNAKLNRLRDVMKSESELMNRAYIALGKDYYEQIKKGEKPDSEREAKLAELIDNCKARIAKARDCYRQIVEKQNEFLYVIGEYVGKTYMETKHRPRYIISDRTWDKKEEEDIVEAAADAYLDDEAPVEELF